MNTGTYQTLTSVGVGVQSASDATATAGNTYTYRVIATGSPESSPSNEAVAVLRGMEADAFVRAGANAGLNYGGSATLEMKLNTTVDNNREAFVRFTLTDVQGHGHLGQDPIYGNAVTTAKTIAISGVSDITWVEGTGTGQAVTGIKFNNKPAIGSQVASQSVNTTAGFKEFDITSYVQAQKTAGATKISLSIRQLTSAGDGQTVFQSKESATAANRPLVLISSK